MWSSHLQTIINTSCAVSYETVIGPSVARSDHNLNVTFVLSDAGVAA